MSARSLREALEAELAVLPIMRYDSNEYPTQALAKARLLDLLAMHPARPLPTREQIAAALRKRLVDSNFNDNLHEPIRFQTIDVWADVLAGAVVLLLDGAQL